MRIIKPLGFYPPLLWKKFLVDGFALRGITIANILLRFLLYPFNFALNTLFTLSFVLASMVLNVASLFNSDWSNFSKKLNRTAYTRCLWVLFDVFGFILNQTKLIIGLVWGPLAITTLNDLKDIATSQSNTGETWGWQEHHFEVVRKQINFFFEHDMHMIGHTIGVIAIELLDAMKFAWRMPHGIGTIHDYGLNPATISPEQAQHTPLLCLHGNMHNQSIMIPLAKHLQDKQYPGPVFTLNLPIGDHSNKDVELIKKRVEDIKQLYIDANVEVSKFKLDVLGYSRGALLAYSLGFESFEIEGNGYPATSSEEQPEPNPMINKTIIIGTDGKELWSTSAEDPEEYEWRYRTEKEETHIIKPLYINGKYDSLLFFNTPPKKQDNMLLFNTGHLGLLFDADVLDSIHDNLVNNPEQAATCNNSEHSSLTHTQVR